MPTEGQNMIRADAGNFATTHWSMVLAVGRPDDQRAREALEKLCRIYWAPLHAYVCRCGYHQHDAQDLTQEFFARLLEKETLHRVDPAKGRFRSFLLTSLKNFLANWRDYQRAQKRGGGKPLLRLDGDSAESWQKLEPADANLSPDKAYERCWALTVLRQVLARLRAEQIKAGKEDLFESIKGFLTGESSAVSYADVARKNGTTESAIKMIVSRLRRRYRELIREEIAQTVASPEEIEDELRYLLLALG